MQGKDILVFCDGTGKDGDRAEDELAGGSDLTPSGYAARSDGRPRMLFYIRGVGAGSVRNPVNLLARIFGATIVESIVSAYLHISRNYQPGDDIYLFGYSRGAYVARKVASLIYRIGLGIRERSELLKCWSQHEKPVAWALPDSRNKGKDIRIKCLVVWDTVGKSCQACTEMKMPNKIGCLLGAVFTKPVRGRERDLLGMPDSELPPNVDLALHAMAFHENRRLFRATLFKSNDHTRLREIWFPGAHADVGGGGKAVSDLPNISLLWVIGELAEYIKIPNDNLDYPDLGTLTPTDAYHDSPPCRRLLDRCETRLESKLLKPNSFVHETVAYLRNALPSSLDPRPRPTPHILSLHDLSAIQWDIRAYLVSCNKLESWKRSASMIDALLTALGFLDAKDGEHSGPEFYFEPSGSYASSVKRASAPIDAS
ncbi:hypothetical protein FRC06_003109 [Ceratobasidium sp. 370]|nr:hypothetical protein FRC06_003109 [Ceratobasidium sp. 370]